MNNSNFIYGDQNIQVPAHLNYGKYMLDQLRRYKDEIALENSETHEKLTYSELTKYSVNLSIYLAKLGVGVGDVVALGSEIRIEFIPTALAVVFTGATYTPFDLKIGRAILKHKLSIAKPKYLICTSLFWGTYKDLLWTFDCIKTVMTLDDFTESLISVKSHLTNAVDVNHFEPATVSGQSDVAFILYSSGTTGMPKGVQLTHLNCILSSLPYNFHAHFSSQTVVYTNAIWYHNYCTFMTFKFLYTGCKLVYINRIRRDLTTVDILKCIDEHKVNVAFIVPSTAIQMSKLEENGLKLDSLKIIYSRTAPLHEKTIEKLKTRFVNLQNVLQGYGMTECGEPASEIWGTKGPKPGSVGMPCPGLVIKVVDLETNDTVGPNQRGEIRVSGPLFMKGYIGIDPATYLDEQGFYKTGDLGYYDEDKYFYIVNRVKDTIKSNGYQIAPLELESILLTHPKVQDVAVVGKPHPLFEELPTAFVVKRPGVHVAEHELLDFVASEVAPYMQLSGGVRFVDAIPRNLRGKIMRRTLREMLEEELNL